jgi:methylamine dehydrogenase accessory protein MauD
MTGVWLIAFTFLWVLVLIEAFLIFAILRQLGVLSARLPERPTGLAAGTRAPDYRLPDLGGQAVSLSSYSGRGILLAFISPSCPMCKPLLPAINQFYLICTDVGVTVQVICEAAVDECRRLAEEYAIAAPMLVDEAGTASQLYRVPGVPHVVSIDTKGVVRRSGTAKDLAGLQSISGVRAAGASGGRSPNQNRAAAETSGASAS